MAEIHYVETGYVSSGYYQTGVTVDWDNSIINIPIMALVLVQSTPTVIYDLDIDTFRRTLKDLEDNADGMTYSDTHSHNTTVTVGGVDLARVVEILPPYTITFEDGSYAVNLKGANSNIGDRINVNSVSVRSANSAGLVTSAAIEFGEYDGGVTVDVIDGEGGTIYPIGTNRRPVNNIPDARLIALVRGFTSFIIKGDITLGVGDDISDVTVIGDNTQRTSITVNPDASSLDAELMDATVQGTLDGNATLNNCHLSTLAYVNGDVRNCILNPGVITLGGGASAHFLNCTSGVPGISTPEINCGGSGQSLALRNYTGGIKISNKTGSDPISIDLESGQVILDEATVTAGTIIVRGDGKVTDTQGNHILTGTWNGGVTIFNETPSALHPHTLDSIADAVWQAPEAAALIEEVHYIERAVHINTEALTQGIGTQASPFNTLEAGLDFAELNNYKLIHVLSDITLDRNVKNFVISGVGLPSVDCNGQNIDRSRFDHCTMKGLSTGFVTVQESALFAGFQLNGNYETCTLLGDLVAAPSASIDMFNCFSSVRGLGFPAIDGINGSVSIRGYKGSLGFTNCTAGIHSVGISEGRFLADNTCTGGTVHVRGLPFEIIDTSGVGCDVVRATDTEAIWNESL